MYYVGDKRYIIIACICDPIRYTSLEGSPFHVAMKYVEHGVALLLYLSVLTTSALRSTSFIFNMVTVPEYLTPEQILQVRKLRGNGGSEL